jgi:hypothetical protein
MKLNRLLEQEVFVSGLTAVCTRPSAGESAIG